MELPSLGSEVDWGGSSWTVGDGNQLVPLPPIVISDGSGGTDGTTTWASNGGTAAQGPGATTAPAPARNPKDFSNKTQFKLAPPTRVDGVNEAY